MYIYVYIDKGMIVNIMYYVYMSCIVDGPQKWDLEDYFSQTDNVFLGSVSNVVGVLHVSGHNAYMHL